MIRQLRNPNFYLMLLADALGIVAALVLAYALRFDFFASPDFDVKFRLQLYYSLPIFIPLKLLLFFAFGLYRGMWRYTNLHDMRKIAGATASVWLLIVSFVAYRFHFLGFSRGIYLLDALLTFFFSASLRIVVREFFSLRTKGRIINPFKWVGDARMVHRQRTIVIGAGVCGEQLLRELSIEAHAPYEVVCYLDDDRAKQHRSLHGVRIFGGVDQLSAAAQKFEAELILVAIAKIDGPGMRRIIESCEATGLPFKRIPTAGSIANGQVSLKELRDVNYEDLLSRPPVVLDDSSISTYLTGKTVLVTGAGGSIGSELVRQIVRFNPASLILIEAGEENLFKIEMELRNELGFSKIIPALARVQDEPVVRKLFEKYRPQVVFHAAAYKHVPLMEQNPWQAIENNVLGSYMVMTCARDCGVDRFVLVSTDKAVRPTNVMGASKRMTELIMHSLTQNSATIFMAVRFGNVLGSSGSVIPTFRRQIERGGPVTVTHPEMTRYFMLIPEAARLILQAGALGQGGEIFILKMGTPVKITEMARDLIRLSGKDPNTEIKIEFTGMRPGEKLYEELITEGEGIVPTQHEKIMVLRSVTSINESDIQRKIEMFRSLAAAHDALQIKKFLQEIIPEYVFGDSEAVL